MEIANVAGKKKGGERAKTTAAKVAQLANQAQPSAKLTI
jgi:hypothetical protein